MSFSHMNEINDKSLRYFFSKYFFYFSINSFDIDLLYLTLNKAFSLYLMFRIH